MPRSIRRPAEAIGLEDLPEHLSGCRAALVITGPSRRHFERLVAVLPSLRLEPFAEARRHVPLPLVERAARELHESGADVVVALGGGSSIGLGKALRLRSRFFFVAIPTTYAGSEATDIHGVTSASEKVTGRDSRVVPDLVVYDPSLLLDMPLSLSVTSLMNALAHPISALSTGLLDATWHQAALAASASVHRAIVAVLGDPHGLEPRRLAFQGAREAARVLAACPVGFHHAHAHAVGGLLDLDHARLHAALLPYSVERLAQQAPAIGRELSRALGTSQPAAAVFDRLAEAGVPTSLSGLGVSHADVERLLSRRPDLSEELLARALSGGRP